MPSVDEFLQTQRLAGTLDSSGRFGLDIKPALCKLGKFLLATPAQAVLKMLQYGIAQKAEAVSILPTSGGYCLYFLGLNEAQPPEEMLSHLLEVLTGEVEDDHRDLLVGLAYFLMHGGDVRIARWQAGHLVDIASTQVDGSAAMQGPHSKFPDVLCVEIRFPTALDEAELRRRLTFCPAPIWLGKHKLNQDKAHLGTASYTHSADLGYTLKGDRHTVQVTALVRDLSEPQEGEFPVEVVLLKHGVALEPIVLTARVPGIRLFVPADDVQTTLGSLQVQTCPAWEARLAALAELLDSVSNQVRLKATRARSQTVDFPTMLGYLIKLAALIGLLYSVLTRSG